MVKAIDFDGTLATYEKGQYPHIGQPVPLMLERCRQWRTDGVDFVIFSARIHEAPEQAYAIKRWCLYHGLGNVKVTNIKTPDMTEFWDDRAVAIQPNTGKLMGASHDY